VTDRPADSASDPANPAVLPKPPRTVRYALMAIIAQVAFTVLDAALVWGYKSQITTWLIDGNKALDAKSKSKRPVDTYLPGSAKLTKDVHDFRVNTLTHALIIGALFAVAALSIWRGRAIAKWLYIAASVVFSVTGVFAFTSTLPFLLNLTIFLAAAASVVGIVLLILPESARYFASTKALRPPPASARAGRPAPTGADAPPRPAGLRGLFAPPPPRAPRTAPAAGAPRPAGLRGLFAPPPPRTPATPAVDLTNSPNARPSKRRSTTDASAVLDDAVTATDSTENVGRGKPKARVTGPEAPAAPGAPAARSRGKSRRN
jgi:hypothetical protein